MKWIKKVATTPLDAIAKVIDTLQSQTNDTTNAPSIRAVNEALNNKWQEIYPVGSIYMSVNAVDPATVFGGTWQQIKDKFLLASGDTYTNGETGGEASHTLTVDELPVHTHSFGLTTGVEGHTLTVEEIPSHTHNYTKATAVQSHTLTGDEIPSHEHELEYSKVTTDSITAGTTTPVVTGLGIGDEIALTETDGGGQGHTHGLTTTGATSESRGGGEAHTHNVTNTTSQTGEVGQGESIDTMPPYLAVNVWVRTA